MEFLPSFLRRHYMEKPEVAWPNVGCFLRLVLLKCSSRIYARYYYVFYLVSHTKYRVQSILGKTGAVHFT